MSFSSRREFLKNSAKGVATTGLVTFGASIGNDMPAKNIFVHHVYFWLKNPENREDKSKLLKGLKILSKVKTIKMFHIGIPADTNRDVIDTSYSLSWLLVFNNKQDQERYQTDPIHLNFVETCKDLWKKVVVYDSVDAN